MANCPQGNSLAERSNQPILQRLQTDGILGTSERDVDLFFAEVQFNNLTSMSLLLSPFGIDEGRTPSFPLEFPRIMVHAHESSTLNDYMHRVECSFDSVCTVLAEESRRQLHIVLQMDKNVRVPEERDEWWVLVPKTRQPYARLLSRAPSRTQIHNSGTKTLYRRHRSIVHTSMHSYVAHRSFMSAAAMSRLFNG